MAQRGVLRPGFVQIKVLDMDAAIAHYRDHMGLDLVGIEADGRAYFKAYDEFDRHSVVLREADAPGIDVMAFKVYCDEDLDVFAKRLNDIDVKTKAIDANEQPSVGRRVRFETPTGHVFDLYAEMALSDNGPMIKNPDVWRAEPRAMRIQRFDHCALIGIDIAAAAKIFTDALDFSITERAIIPDNGEPVAIFLTCSNKAHDIAFLGNPEHDGKLHHVSFNLEDWKDIGHAADLISRYNIPLDIGPTRHGITRGQTIYFFDPSGNRNETFSGGYSFYPDTPIREWTVDQMGKAIFYYEKEVHGRFVEVFT